MMANVPMPTSTPSAMKSCRKPSASDWPTIGMWDNQGPTPGTGDYPLHRDTVYAIEGNVAVSLAEWGGQRVQIMLEQGALFDGKGVRYLAGRQTDWHLIR